MQVNKNWMLKARVGSDSAAVAAVLKAWWQPSATFAVSAVYDFAKRFPRLGFTVNLENYGNIRSAPSRPLSQDSVPRCVQGTDRMFDVAEYRKLSISVWSFVSVRWSMLVQDVAAESCCSHDPSKKGLADGGLVLK